MGLGQCGIDFDRALRCLADIRRRLIVGNDPSIKEKDVRSSYRGMGLCIIWILRNRLVELIQCVINAPACALLQVKASFYVELVGLGILGGMLFLFATDFQPQLAGNVRRNV